MFRYSIRTLLILTILVAVPLTICSPRRLTLKSLPNSQPSTAVQPLAQPYKVSGFRYISEDFLNHEDYFEEYSHVLVSQQSDGVIVRELVVGRGPKDAPFELLGGRAKLHDSIPGLEELNKFATIDEFESLFGWKKKFETYGSSAEGWFSCLTYSGFVIFDNQIHVTWVHLYVHHDPVSGGDGFVTAEDLEDGWRILSRDLIQLTYEVNGKFAPKAK